MRRIWMAVAGATAIVIGIVLVAFQVASRDREALVARFSEERLAAITEAARTIQSQLREVHEHLRFAAHLSATAGTDAEERRALEGILASVAEYKLFGVYDGAGHRRYVVTDPLAIPPAQPSRFEETLDEAAGRALVSSGVVVAAGPHERGGEWFREFAISLSSRAGRATRALVMAVDVESMLSEQHALAALPSSRLLLVGTQDTPLVFDGSGRVLPSEPFGLPLAHRIRDARARTFVVTEGEAEALGLPRAEAVAALAPVKVSAEVTWTAAFVSSTASLHAQTRGVAIRTGIVAAIVLAVLAVLTSYVAIVSRRAIELRERLRSAERVAHLSEKAEKIFDAVPVGVFTLSDDGRISALNRAWRTRVPDGAIGQPLVHAFPDAEPEALMALHRLLEEARRTGVPRTSAGRPLLLTRPETPFVVHVVPLQHHAPEVRSLVVMHEVVPGAPADGGSLASLP